MREVVKKALVEIRICEERRPDPESGPDSRIVALAAHLYYRTCNQLAPEFYSTH